MSEFEVIASRKLRNMFSPRVQGCYFSLFQTKAGPEAFVSTKQKIQSPLLAHVDINDYGEFTLIQPGRPDIPLYKVSNRLYVEAK